MSVLHITTAAWNGMARKSLIGFGLYDQTYLKNIAQGGKDLFSSGNFLPYMDDNGIPNLAGGNPPNNIVYTLAVPSDLVANSSPGANDGTELIISWTGSATNGSGQAIGTDFGGAYVSIASGGDPDGLVDTGALSLKFYMANNGGRPSGGKVRFFFDTVPGTWNFAFIGGSQFTTFDNLAICRATDWDFVDSSTFEINASTPEQLINPAFVSVYQDLGCSIVRPMGWTNPNDGNNCSRHSYRLPWKTGLGFACGTIRPTVVVGDNGSGAGIATGTDTYAAAAPSAGGSGAYVDGETFQVFIPNATVGAGPFTFNVAARGAIPLLNADGAALSGITANTVATLVYSKILNGFYLSPHGMSANVPIELQVAAANLTNSHFWYNLQPFIDAASVAAVAELVRDQLNANLASWWEYANEIWNWGFSFTHFSYACGLAMGFPDSNNRPYHGFTGMKTAQFMPLIKTAWTATRSDNQCNGVLAFQCYGDPAATETYRMLGADLAPSGTHTGVGNSVWNAYTGSADFTQEPDRPIDVCKVLSPATYYAGAQILQFPANYRDEHDAGINTFADLLAAADNYASGNSSLMTSAIEWMDADVRAGTRTNGSSSGAQTLDDLMDRYGVWNALAEEYAKFIDLYEGGFGGAPPDAFSCTYIGISTDYVTKINNLIEAYKYTDLFYDTVLLQYQQFMARSRSRTPAQLLVAGPNPWSLKPGDSLALTRYTSFGAVADWNHGVG